MADLKHAGSLEVARDRLKMVVKTGVSSAAQSLSNRPCTPSGPAAFLGLMLRRAESDIMGAQD